MKKQSLEEFLGARELAAPFSDYMLDKLRLPHGLTARQRKKLEADAHAAADQYADARAAAIKEYESKVAAGEIEPKGAVERLIECANSHPDNEATQAARRILAKRNINWEKRTGGNL